MQYLNTASLMEFTSSKSQKIRKYELQNTRIRTTEYGKPKNKWKMDKVSIQNA